MEGLEIELSKVAPPKVTDLDRFSRAQRSVAWRVVREGVESRLQLLRRMSTGGLLAW
jgi:hypothetical protein